MEPVPDYLARRPPRHHELRWSHKAWFILRALRGSLGRQLAALGLRDGKALDYGCGTGPYRDLLPAGVAYSGADLPGNPAADLRIAPDGAVPAPDGSFDVVLSTQVLEHVAEPDAYLREAFRLLRPGGTLLLSTHGLWVYHRDPVDYWRWTAEGLRLIARRAGFDVVHLEGLMGLAALSVQLFQDATWHRLPGPLRGPYAFVLQRLVALIDGFYSAPGRVDNAMVYVVVARRPA